VPSISDRIQILSHCAKALPGGAENGAHNLQHLAERCVGFTGADLSALCKKAAMAAVSRGLYGGQGEEEGTVTVNVADGDGGRHGGRICGDEGCVEGGGWRVSAGDWAEALAAATSTGSRGVQTGFEPLSMDSLGGLSGVKEQLRRAIQLPISDPGEALLNP
jgi:SpoVK/Ycf46/Vps4 family AAA+-type ATPase